MTKHIVLVFNMGHCGGRWFQDVCNTHDEVQLWQEANHFLNVSHLETHEQFDTVYDFFMEQYRDNSKRVLGLIKAFDNRLIDFCKEKGGTFFQMFRNPIGVVDAKNGCKMEECKQRGLFKLDSERDIFEAHTEFYAFRYKKYLERKRERDWPIIKLEDLNKSLRENSPYFKDIIEELLKIELTVFHMEKIKELSNISGNLSRAYSENNADKEIFKSWDSWKQGTFLRYFEGVMIASDYRWV